jgi:hypothetical protein
MPREHALSNLTTGERTSDSLFHLLLHLARCDRNDDHEGDEPEGPQHPRERRNLENGIVDALF